MIGFWLLLFLRGIDNNEVLLGRNCNGYCTNKHSLSKCHEMGGLNMSDVKKIIAGVTVVVSALKIVTRHREQIMKEKRKDGKQK